MVSPKGWEIWVIRSREIRFCPSKLLCSILSKKASTQYRRIALHTSEQSETGLYVYKWRLKIAIITIMNKHYSCNHMAITSLTYFQSIAKPFGQPRVVLTMERACDPSPQALIILAGRYQSVQKIYLPNKNKWGFLFHLKKHLLRTVWNIDCTWWQKGLFKFCFMFRAFV